MKLIPTSLLLAVFIAMTASTLTAEPLKPGDPAPAISATTDTGATLNLADVYSKNKYTLVFFYPKAFTSGCTAQGCSLRDAYEVLAEKGVAIIGVSVDDVEAQKKFKAANHFQYVLLADTDMKVKTAFGVPGDARAARQAYLIKGGKIIYADHKGATAKQADNILAAIAADK
jgi:peroxiredoxin Q/BCP